MRFSIVIPVWNNEQWLDHCFKSVLDQTFKDYEVIIVDDMSIDNGMQIIKKYEKLFKNCKILVNKTRRLNGGTRNVGIAEAKGDYIICIDCDDWLVDNKVLEDIDKKLKGEDICYLGYKMGKETKILNINNKDEAFNNNFPAPWLKAVKRELYLKTPFPEGTLFEDRIQNYELVLKSNTFTNLGRATHYWNSDNNERITYSPKWETYRFEYCGELYRLIKERPELNLKEELNLYMKSINEMVKEL